MKELPGLLQADRQRDAVSHSEGPEFTFSMKRRRDENNTVQDSRKDNWLRQLLSTLTHLSFDDPPRDVDRPQRTPWWATSEAGTEGESPAH
jgi:hypothetical protein